MTGRAGPLLRVAGLLTRFVLAAVSFLLVGLTAFLVAFGAAAIVTPSASYDAILALGMVVGLAGGSVAAFGVWRLLARRRSS